MSYQPDDRVLIRPIGVYGTVLGPARVPGTVKVQADSGGPPLPWLESELEPAAG